MTKKEKRLQRIRQNPKAVSLKDLLLVMEDFAYRIREGSGSHIFANMQVEDREWTVTIARPHGKRKFVNSKTVKIILNQLDEIEAYQAELENEEDND